MTFIVDGQDWQFDGLSDDQVRAEIDKVLEFVAISNARDQRVLIGDDFQTREMMAGLGLWELLGPNAQIEISGEVWQELAAWLGPNPLYTILDDWPDQLDDTVIIGNEPPVENADIAWAHHHNRACRATACFSLTRHGSITTETAHGTSDVHFVRNERQCADFWRDAIVLEGDTSDTLFRIYEKAYPNLYFHNAVIFAVNQLDGGYDASRHLVRSALATLDDHAGWIFNRPPPTLGVNDAFDATAEQQPTNQIVIDRFRGVGLVVAPENPDVFQNRPCREAREINIDGRQLYCHWHVKIEPHRNRIHIHPPVPESSGRVVIAIIHEHLPLP